MDRSKVSLLLSLLIEERTILKEEEDGHKIQSNYNNQEGLKCYR